MAFGLKDKIIVSVGVIENNSLCLHSVEMGHAIKTLKCPATCHSTNKIVMLEETCEEGLFWVTLGAKGSMVIWETKFNRNCNIDLEIKEGMKNTEVMNQEVTMPSEELQESNFLTAAYRDDRILIGCSDGTVCSFDLDGNKMSFIEGGRKVRVGAGRPIPQISQITIKSTSVVIGTSDGNLYNY